jgi:hypothetical protein
VGGAGGSRAGGLVDDQGSDRREPVHHQPAEISDAGAGAAAIPRLGGGCYDLRRQMERSRMSPIAPVTEIARERLAREFDDRGVRCLYGGDLG